MNYLMASALNSETYFVRCIGISPIRFFGGMPNKYIFD